MNGTCHATESAFPVSNPTKTLVLIPGPRVAHTMSGLRRVSLPFDNVTSLGRGVSAEGAGGKLVSALLTSFARFS